jgi:signal transduction histidine kinase
MSLRLRVLGLFLLVAVVTAAGTGVLTFYQAGRQVSHTVRVGQQQVARIAGALREYGQVHGTWYGVDGQVRRLSKDTGQRIRLTDQSGRVIADSDLLAGRAARPTAGTPSLVDARPTLPSMLGLPDAGTAVRSAEKRLGVYRFGYAYAACLTRAGIPVTVRHADSGAGSFPEYLVGGRDLLVSMCDRSTPETAYDRDIARLDGCVPDGGGARKVTRAVDACLRTRFAQQAAGFAPTSLELYVGARNQEPASLPVLPVLGAAGAVALLAAAVALVLSRRVLRPVRQLTAAAGRVAADGTVAERVPVLGSDELATLARSFNRMADSLDVARDRQRRQIADVAHELRTPLANLRGYLEALADGVIAPTPELFDSLHEEALLQQRLVDDLHELALAEAGALTYHRVRTDVAELVEACAVAHRPAAVAAGVRLTAAMAGPAYATVDPDRLRQVVANLVTNALRATPSGGRVVLAVRVAAGRVAVDVTDTGHGIAADELSRVFDRFWRADSARTRGGSGLGLAVARQLVADHGGTLTATSTPGAGSTFTITLPADQPE